MLCSTIREIMVQSGEKFRDVDAIRYKKGKNEIICKTYGELCTDLEKFSKVLDKLGVQGKHIAVTGATTYEWVVAYLGITCSGSVAVPLDVLLPAEEMCELIDRSDALVLVADEVRGDVIAAAKERCPQLKYIISMQKPEAAEGVLSFWELMNEEESCGCSQEKENCECSTSPCGRTYPKPDQLATIMFTSGTTGKSKGVMLTHRNLAENATCLDMKLPRNTVLLSVLPIHHAYCLTMDFLKGLSNGSTVCLNDSLMRMAKNIKLFKPNMILMVPLMIETMAKKLEAAEGMDPALVKKEIFGDQFTAICSGGAYLPPAMLDLFKKYDIDILQGYGMTECAPVISTTVSWDIRKGTVGQLLPNCEAKVVDEELWVRGSSVMQGYYKMPEETAETLVDGWLRTGDLGYVDEEGFVYLTGRKKNLIITKNGENVSPEELENKIGENRLVCEILVRENEGVIEAEIFPDMEFVQKKEIVDVAGELQKLIDTYNAGAPAYKRVYRLKVRDTEFAKTPSKKIKRY